MRDSYVTRCVAIRFRLCWRHTDDLFVWFGAKPTQRTEDEITSEIGSGGEKRIAEKTERPTWQSWEEEDGWLEIAVQGKYSHQKEAVREASQRWVSIPSGFKEVSRKIHARDSLQRHEKLHKIVTQTSLSCAWSLPKPVFVRLFFLPPSRLYFAYL